MKKILSILLLSTAAMPAAAQRAFVVSVSGGINHTSSAMKHENHTGNGFNLQGDVVVPVINNQNGRFALGILATGNYAAAKRLTPATGNVQDAYKLYNGKLDIATAQRGSATSKGFTGALGLQADFKLGRLTLSPSLSGGYFSYKQAGFTQSSELVDNNGNSKTITLLQLSETKSTGFITRPQLKIGYPITKTFNIYTAAALNIGPETNAVEQKLEPAGGFNDKHTYEPAQLSAGKMAERAVSNRYQTMNLNAGISWNIGGNARRLKGKVIKTGDNGAKQQNPLYQQSGNSANNPLYGSSAMARPGNHIGGIIVKGGKNPGGNLLVATSDDKGTFSFDGLETGLYQFTLTAPAEPQGKSISEKGVKRSEATVAARPGNPIGGIIVKGGKGPGGGMTKLTVDGSGTIQFEVLEAGNYRFTIEAEGADQQNGSKKKKVTEKATTGLKDALKTNV